MVEGAASLVLSGHATDPTVHGVRKLWTQADLQVIDRFMHKAHLELPPFGDCMPLQDQISVAAEIYDVQLSGVGFGTQRRAARLAAPISVSGADFADYYATFVRLLERPAGSKSSCRAARTNLARCLMPYLRCPVFSGDPTPSNLHDQLVDWITEVGDIGFVSVARGIRVVVANTDGIYGSPREALEATERVASVIRAMVRAAPPQDSGRLGQDGSTRTYVIEAESLRLDLQLDATGELTVSDLHR